MLSDQYLRNDIDKGGIGLLKQREQAQLEYRTLGDQQVSGHCCGERRVLIKRKHEGVEYRGERGR